MQPSIRTLNLTYLSLLGLLALTAFVSSLQLGAWSLVIGLGIAAIKAILVLLFFMHLKYSDPKIKVVAIAAALWIFVLFSITITDYVSRGVSLIPGK